MSPPKVVEIRKASAITPCQKFGGHADVVLGATHLPGGQQMMTCSSDGSLRVWNLKSGKQIGDDWRDGESGVWTIALSPDGKKVVSGSEDGGVRLWDIDTCKVIAKWAGHTNIVRTVSWSRDGQRVLSGSYDGTARQWDVENGAIILTPIKTGHKWVNTVIYSPDMTMFATGGSEQPRNNESPVKIWDTKTGELITILQGHTDSVLCLAWTPNGKTLISGSFDDLIRIWNTTTWKQLAVLKGHTTAVHSIAVNPNGRILASASWDDTARLWNLDNNQPISSPLEHTTMVFCVSFSADGKLLATGCDDKNAYTWDVSTIVKEAGLDELLLDQHDKSLLVADATQRLVRQPIKVSNRVPHGFFDGAPHPAHSSARLDPHGTPPRLRIFHWARDLFSARPSGADIELHERPSAVVDAPYAKGKRRNASARERRMVIIPLKSKNPTASTSCPPNGNATQSSGAAQPQSPLQPQAAVSTPSTTPPSVANTTPSTNPHIIIKHAGRWTRFWVSICCTSSEYTDDHH
jgi:WD40 repeat protein